MAEKDMELLRVSDLDSATLIVRETIRGSGKNDYLCPHCHEPVLSAISAEQAAALASAAFECQNCGEFVRISH